MSELLSRRTRRSSFSSREESNQIIDASDTKLAVLLGMGFNEPTATNALKNCDNDVDKAIGWCVKTPQCAPYEGPISTTNISSQDIVKLVAMGFPLEMANMAAIEHKDEDFNKLVAFCVAQSNTEGQSFGRNISISSGVEQLARMGFERSQCDEALKQCNNDISKAIAFCVAQNSPGPDASEPVSGVTLLANGTSNASALDNVNDSGGKKKRQMLMLSRRSRPSIYMSKERQSELQRQVKDGERSSSENAEEMRRKLMGMGFPSSVIESALIESANDIESAITYCVAKEKDDEAEAKAEAERMAESTKATTGEVRWSGQLLSGLLGYVGTSPKVADTSSSADSPSSGLSASTSSFTSRMQRRSSLALGDVTGKIDQLMGMGFSLMASEQALHDADGDVGTATAVLCSSPPTDFNPFASDDSNPFAHDESNTNPFGFDDSGFDANTKSGIGLLPRLVSSLSSVHRSSSAVGNDTDADTSQPTESSEIEQAKHIVRIVPALSTATTAPLGATAANETTVIDNSSEVFDMLQFELDSIDASEPAREILLQFYAFPSQQRKFNQSHVRDLLFDIRSMESNVSLVDETLSVNGKPRVEPQWISSTRVDFQHDVFTRAPPFSGVGLRMVFSPQISAAVSSNVSLYFPTKVLLWQWVKWISLASDIWKGMREMTDVPAWASSGELCTTGTIKLVLAEKVFMGRISLSLTRPNELRCLHVGSRDCLCVCNLTGLESVDVSVDSIRPKQFSVKIEVLPPDFTSARVQDQSEDLMSSFVVSDGNQFFTASWSAENGQIQMDIENVVTNTDWEGQQPRQRSAIESVQNPVVKGFHVFCMKGHGAGDVQSFAGHKFVAFHDLFGGVEVLQQEMRNLERSHRMSTERNFEATLQFDMPPCLCINLLHAGQLVDLGSGMSGRTKSLTIECSILARNGSKLKLSTRNGPVSLTVPFANAIAFKNNRFLLDLVAHPLYAAMYIHLEITAVMMLNEKRYGSVFIPINAFFKDAVEECEFRITDPLERSSLRKTSEILTTMSSDTRKYESNRGVLKVVLSRQTRLVQGNALPSVRIHSQLHINHVTSSLWPGNCILAGEMDANMEPELCFVAVGFTGLCLVLEEEDDRSGEKSKSKLKDDSSGILRTCLERGAHRNEEIVIPWQQLISVDLITESIVNFRLQLHRSFDVVEQDRRRKSLKKIYREVDVEIFVTNCPGLELRSLVQERIVFCSIRKKLMNCLTVCKRGRLMTEQISPDEPSPATLISDIQAESEVLDAHLGKLATTYESADASALESETTIIESRLCRLKLYAATLLSAANTSRLSQSPLVGIDNRIADDFDAADQIERENEVATTDARVKHLLAAAELQIRDLCLRGWSLKGGLLERGVEKVVNEYLIEIARLLEEFCDGRKKERPPDEAATGPKSGLSNKINLLRTLMRENDYVEYVLQSALKSYNLRAYPPAELLLYLNIDKICSWYSTILSQEMAEKVDDVVAYWQTSAAAQIKEANSNYKHSLPWLPLRHHRDRGVFMSTIPEEVSGALGIYLDHGRLGEEDVTASFRESMEKLDGTVHVAYTKAFAHLATVYMETVRGQHWTESSPGLAEAESMEQLEEHLEWLCSVVNDSRRISESAMICAKPPESDETGAMRQSTNLQELHMLSATDASYGLVTEKAVEQISCVAFKLFVEGQPLWLKYSAHETWLPHDDMESDESEPSRAFADEIQDLREVINSKRDYLCSFGYFKLVERAAEKVVFRYLHLLRSAYLAGRQFSIAGAASLQIKKDIAVMKSTFLVLLDGKETVKYTDVIASKFDVLDHACHLITSDLGDGSVKGALQTMLRRAKVHPEDGHALGHFATICLNLRTARRRRYSEAETGDTDDEGDGSRPYQDVSPFSNRQGSEHDDASSSTRSPSQSNISQSIPPESIKEMPGATENASPSLASASASASASMTGLKKRLSVMWTAAADIPSSIIQQSSPTGLSAFTTIKRPSLSSPSSSSIVKRPSLSSISMGADEFDRDDPEKIFCDIIIAEMHSSHMDDDDDEDGRNDEVSQAGSENMHHVTRPRKNRSLVAGVFGVLPLDCVDGSDFTTMGGKDSTTAEISMREFLLGPELQKRAQRRSTVSSLIFSVESMVSSVLG